MTQSSIESSAEGQLLASREKFLAFVRRKVADPELAEDLLQDSLLKAIQAAPKLRNDDSLIPWFYRILNNSIIDAYRKKASHANHLEEIELEDLPAPADEQAALCECFREVLPTLKPEYA